MPYSSLPLGLPRGTAPRPYAKRPFLASTIPMRYILLYILCLTTLNLSAQSFNFPKASKHIYAVPAETIERLSSKEASLNDLPGLGLPYPAGTDVAKLPPGHYLTTRLKGENVAYEQLPHLHLLK